MATVGQVSSFCSAGGGASPTACDLEPKSWPNRSAIDGLESDEPEPNRLPPPQPDSAAAAIASTTRPRRRPVRPAPILCIKRIVQIPGRSQAFGALLCRARRRGFRSAVLCILGAGSSRQLLHENHTRITDFQCPFRIRE